VDTIDHSGYGNFEPPKKKKRHPLTRHDTERLYQEASEFPDVETELSVRVLMDFGLRVGELTHTRAKWVAKENNSQGQEIWRITIPRVEYCWGGTGGSTGHKNPGGADLHNTDDTCTHCTNRTWEEPVNGNPNYENDNGWVTEKQAEEYDWTPKKQKSASTVWQFPTLKESAETAQKLKQFLKAQPHEQWPHMEGSVRNRIQKVADRAELDLPNRPNDQVVPHSLRHTYGCRLVEMGVNQGIGMEQMRHRNPEVFQWYSQVRGTRVVSALADAASENDALL
jgi:integrase